MLYVVDMEKGVVLQRATDSGPGEDDLWLWIDEVSTADRHTLTVMAANHIIEQWGEIKWGTILANRRRHA